jgi:AcrR family transcriptional regulator
MGPAREADTAPKRGRYDRTLSRHERQSAQLERVLAAVAAVSASGRPMCVADVVEQAGIGRNTFYEYFDDIEHALAAIKGRARRELATRVEAALPLARTPLERIRVLGRVWTEALIANPALARLALRAEPHDADELSELGRYIASLLTDEVAARSALPGLADPMRVTAVAALFDVVSRRHLVTRSAGLEELPRVLADLALRILR